MIRILKYCLLLTILISCQYKDKEKKIELLLVDTLNLRKQHLKVEIDSVNSGISRNLKEIKDLRDSIDIVFDGYFNNVPVTLIFNKTEIFQDTLQTDNSTGYSTIVRFKRGLFENNFDMRIEGNRYEFKEKNKYNFVHISDTKAGFGIVFTNKCYVYD
jgi:hypothetical protein